MNLEFSPRFGAALLRVGLVVGVFSVFASSAHSAPAVRLAPVSPEVSTRGTAAFVATVEGGSVAKLEFDATGSDEFVAVEGASGRTLIRHSYPVEGTFTASVRATHPEGHISLAKAEIRVIPWKQLDASVQKVWADFRKALLARNLDAVLALISEVPRGRIASIFRGREDRMPEFAEQSGAPEFSSEEGGVIRYAVSRKEVHAGVEEKATYEITFLRDFDGRIRIASF